MIRVDESPSRRLQPERLAAPAAVVRVPDHAVAYRSVTRDIEFAVTDVEAVTLWFTPVMLWFLCTQEMDRSFGWQYTGSVLNETSAMCSPQRAPATLRRHDRLRCCCELVRRGSNRC